MAFLSPRIAWWLFISSLIVLIGITYAGDRAAANYADSEWWVSHTREVETQIALLRADISASSSTRFQYKMTGDQAILARNEERRTSVPVRLARLKQLTSDNPEQQENLAKLTPLVDKRLTLIRDSMAKGPTAHVDQSELAGLDEENVLTQQISDTMRNLESEEEALLKQRASSSKSIYGQLRIILIGALAVVVVMLIFLFRTLFLQLKFRTQAEESVRRLSGHILRTQDMERRRLARDLHDGLGQLFVAMNMEVSGIAGLPGVTPEATQPLNKLVDQGLTETRTISYLLHPPMLDEMGFEQAIRWYVDGYTKRSSVTVGLDIPPGFGRIQPDIELVLFRVIQEALTNIHKHSGSTKAEIHVKKANGSVYATIRDFGRGISPELLQRMEQSAMGLGVGLGGMRERVREFHGHFDIASTGSGTIVSVSVPLPDTQTAVAGGDSSAPPLKVEAQTARTADGRSEPQRPSHQANWGFA